MCVCLWRHGIDSTMLDFVELMTRRKKQTKILNRLIDDFKQWFLLEFYTFIELIEKKFSLWSKKLKQKFPRWFSLALDYLNITRFSFYSERDFSQADIFCFYLYRWIFLVEHQFFTIERMATGCCAIKILFPAISPPCRCCRWIAIEKSS